MKNTLLIVLGFFLFPIASDISKVSNYYLNVKQPMFLFIPSAGMATVLTSGCTKDISKNGHGWVFVNREYYQCNSLQIFFSDMIFGEYTDEN